MIIKLIQKKITKNPASKNNKFIDITNLSNKHDFIKLRAETDSDAVKKKFSFINIL